MRGPTPRRYGHRRWHELARCYLTMTRWAARGRPRRRRGEATCRATRGTYRWPWRHDDGRQRAADVAGQRAGARCPTRVTPCCGALQQTKGDGQKPCAIDSGVDQHANPGITPSLHGIRRHHQDRQHQQQQLPAEDERVSAVDCLLEHWTPITAAGPAGTGPLTRATLAACRCAVELRHVRSVTHAQPGTHEAERVTVTSTSVPVGHSGRNGLPSELGGSQRHIAAGDTFAR